jgi:hypothetical protein
MAAVLVVAIGLSPVLTLVFLGFVSFLALKEFFSLIPTRRTDRRVLFWAYLAVPVQFYWIGTGRDGMFIVFVPVYAFVLLPPSHDAHRRDQRVSARPRDHSLAADDHRVRAEPRRLFACPSDPGQSGGGRCRIAPLPGAADRGQ